LFYRQSFGIPALQLFAFLTDDFVIDITKYLWKCGSYSVQSRYLRIDCCTATEHGSCTTRVDNNRKRCNRKSSQRFILQVSGTLAYTNVLAFRQAHRTEQRLWITICQALGFVTKESIYNTRARVRESIVTYFDTLNIFNIF